MSTPKKRISFFESEEGTAVLLELEEMATNKSFNTRSSYSANGKLHPDNLISFVEKHKNYLNTHPAINPRQYVANLRLMTRVR